jgi:hypothetical protein
VFKRYYFKDVWLTVCMLMAYGLTGCVSDEVGGVYLVSQEPESMYPVANHYVEILFQAGGDWTASTSMDWLEVTPSQGSGGRNAVTLRTKSANRTKAERSALLTIVSDGKQESMTIRQSGDYAVFDQDEYVVDAAGGPLTLTFTSNMDRSNLYVSYQKLDWISWSEPIGETRTDWLGRMRELTVSPNPSEDERQAIFVLSTYSRRQELMGLDTTRVRQLGVSAP